MVWTKSLGGKYMTAVGTAKNGDKTAEISREIWGPTLERPGVNFWGFNNARELDLVASGQIFREGNKYILVNRGHVDSSKTQSGKGKEVAESLGVGEFDYHSETELVLADKNTIEVTMTKVTVGGKAFPWPGLGETQVLRRVVRD